MIIQASTILGLMSHLSVSNLCTWTSTPMPDCLPQATFMHKWAIFGPT